MQRKYLAALLLLGLVGGIATFSGLAVFTDQETAADNTFTSGDVDLVIGTTSALVTFANMKPGDTTGPQPQLVTNSGSLDFDYVMSTTMDTDNGTPLLGDALDLTIKTIDVTTPATPCDDFDGTTLYGAADLNAGVLASRFLSAGSSETLCFQVNFPSAATGPEGASADANFVFDATQA